jgi:hypothetical protein
MQAFLLALSMLTAQQDSGVFLVRLGADTLSIEQYRRTPTQIKGEYVIRSPRSVHRIYSLDLNPDGTIRRVELISHNIDGGPGPGETKSTAEFTLDSVVISQPRGDSTVTTRVAAPKGTLPFTLHIYAMMEQLGRWARAQAPDSVALSVVSGPTPTGGYARKRGDTVVVAFTQGQLAGLGPFTFRLDRAGRLLSLTGKGSTVQVDVERLPWGAIDLAKVGPAFASRPLGQLSVRDTARATIGGSPVWVDYSKPMKRGREIFGNVVPWNTVWRTGANAATQFNTPVDLVVGGANVPAGKYTLWTLPTPTGWKLIINKQTGQWGTVYDQQQDLARVDATVETLSTPVEQMVIAFEPANAPTTLTVSWDKTKVSVPVAKKAGT